MSSGSHSVVLHIGSLKAGSKTLQRALYRGPLPGWTYPRELMSAGTWTQTRLLEYCLKGRVDDIRAIVRDGRVVLSEEHLFRETYRVLPVLKDAIPEATVVVSLRAHEDFLSSLYRRDVRNLGETRRFADWLLNAPIPQYWPLLCEWSQHYPVIVTTPGDLVPRVFEVMDLSTPHVEAVHRGIGGNLLEMIRLTNDGTPNVSKVSVDVHPGNRAVDEFDADVRLAANLDEKFRSGMQVTDEVQDRILRSTEGDRQQLQNYYAWYALSEARDAPGSPDPSTWDADLSTVLGALPDGILRRRLSGLVRL